MRRGVEQDRASSHLRGAEEKHELSYQELADWQDKEAEELVRHNSGIDALKVVAINLTKSNPSRAANAKKPPTQRRRRTARAAK